MFCSTSFVLCMLVCLAADALVIVAGFCYNSSVHFAAAVFARGNGFFVWFPIYSEASL